MNKKNTQRQKQRKHKINGEVRFPQVRVVGENHGGKIMSSFEASKIAESEGKDLILINENGNPPVVRIEDYNKFIYDQEKREKESQKNVKKSELKEISLSVNIADHDLGVKSKKAIEFLGDGDKVKCNLLMKGRQLSMSTQGELVMLKFAKLVEEYGIPESLPKMEGNRWIMTLKPKKK
jgi:translation initiation factor IF-3